MREKTLFVFANEFPYGTSEAYMETEMQYWTGFDSVYVFSLQLRKKKQNKCRAVAKGIQVIPVRFAPAMYLLYGLRALGDKNLYSELKMLIKNKRLSPRTLAQLFAYVARSHYESDFLKRKLITTHEGFGDVTFYSYRFGYQPYVAYLLREKMKLQGDIYARAHRYDLYENRKKSGYIPMRRVLLKELKFCYPVSDNGTEYLKKCYPQYSDKIQTRYLGTKDHGEAQCTQGKIFRIVTCSNVAPVKRIDLLIDALSCLHEEVEWVHFGGGALLDNMKAYAKEKLPQNVKVIWKGSVANSQILEEYKNERFDLFLNVSSSEGIPVSIMEATSFGMPCIATNAGGTGELVKNEENGLLLPVETTAKEIADSIDKFIKMPADEYQAYRKGARRIWKERFSAENNYRNFFEEIRMR